MRLPQKTSFFEFSRIMPTFERYPLRSIIRFTRLIRHEEDRFFHILSQIESCHEIIELRIGLAYCFICHSRIPDATLRQGNSNNNLSVGLDLTSAFDLWPYGD